MMVIVFLLAMVSVAVVPYVISMRDSQARRALYSGIADLAGQARETAIAENVTTYLEPDTSQNAMLLKEQVSSSNYSSRQGSSNLAPGTTTMVVNGKVESTRTMSNIGTATTDESNDKTLRTLPMPVGLQFGNFQLGGSSSDAGAWRLHFFADGTCDGGGVEINDRGYVKSLVVNNHGGSQIVDGTIPDTSQDRWQAGDYVHRQQ